MNREPFPFFLEILSALANTVFIYKIVFFSLVCCPVSPKAMRGSWPRVIVAVDPCPSSPQRFAASLPWDGIPTSKRRRSNPPRSLWLPLERSTAPPRTPRRREKPPWWRREQANPNSGTVCSSVRQPRSKCHGLERNRLAAATRQRPRAPPAVRLRPADRQLLCLACSGACGLPTSQAGCSLFVFAVFPFLPWAARRWLVVGPGPYRGPCVLRPLVLCRAELSRAVRSHSSA